MDPHRGVDGRWFGCWHTRRAGVVDACLIPEVPFKLHGDSGLLAYLNHVVKSKGHAVMCVAEGAGQVRRSCAVAR